MCAQTKELRAGQYALDSRYERARFLTPYSAQFVTNVKEGAEVAAGAPEDTVAALRADSDGCSSSGT